MDAALANKLVLLVEDEDVLLRGMQAWLRDNEYGYAVMTASDGKKALELIGRYHPDLVISDMRMPGMDGLELLLVSRRRYPDMRFVLMSAYGTRDLEERSRRYGAVRFLHKPVNPSQLERTIVEVLKQEVTDPRAGFLSGISVTGFVQLLAVERKTIALRLKNADGRQGAIYLREGALVHAVCEGLEASKAAMELLAWEDAEMWLDHPPDSIPRSIQRPLPALIMEALRERDEHNREHPASSNR